MVWILLEDIYFVLDGHLYIQLLGASMGLVPSPEVGVLRLFDIFENIIYSDHHNTINAAHFKYINDGLMNINNTESEIVAVLKCVNSKHTQTKILQLTKV